MADHLAFVADELAGRDADARGLRRDRLADLGADRVQRRQQQQREAEHLPTSAWNLPNMALVEVLEPDSATPMKPRTGATTMKDGPSLEKALASEPAMPEKLKT